MRGSYTGNKITLFLVITLLLMALPYFQIIRTGTVQGFVVLALMWAPGIGALLTQLITTRSITGLGWRWGQGRYQLISFLIPLLLCLVVYGLSWGVGLVPFTAAEMVATVAAASGRTLSLPLALLATSVVSFPLSLMAALGEEIGWRGLLVPELAKRYRFTVTALVSGIIWVIFHYPAILFADYNSDAPLWYALTMFTLMALGASFVFAWLRLKSGSLWTAAILHASHNFFVQAIFDTMTLDFGLTPYLTTEFGAGLAIGYALLAFYFWRRRGEVEGGISER
jgi:membrane protease YdiL (CAAX protease family)